ncbi:hypothetical protein BK816_08805 [Boudabousia tangfeifanii]|uniref:HMA domain-containing protein n=1 Tax=Boudabousia tangfeifanii TaxID=1912795 RepID=A0A1D9MM34_9ACTO|nr:hypothetical protein BK816_08805 [Boudabousia tangfeifanii]
MSSFDRTVELDVPGMTCNNCVSHVRTELEALPEVNNVEVILRSEGVSLVTVHINAPISDDALRAAVDEAGYDVNEIRRDDVAGIAPEGRETMRLSDVNATGEKGSGEGGCGCGCGCK